MITPDIVSASTDTVQHCELFRSVGIFINHYVADLCNVAIGTFINELRKIMGAILVVYLIFEGYKIFYGKGGQAPLKELTWDFTNKVILFIVVIGYSTYFKLVFDALLAFSHIFGNPGGNTQDLGAGIYAKLDSMVDVMAKGQSVIDTKYPGSWFCDWGHIFLDAILWTFFAIGFGGVVICVLATSLTTICLLLSAPIAFCALMFKSTKGMFTQWLNILFANLLTLFLIALVIITLSNLINNYTSGFAEGESNPWLVLLGYCTIPMLFGFFVKLVKEMATKFATVSLEHIAGSAISSKLGSVGSLAGKGFGLAKTLLKAGGGHVKLGSSVANAVGNTASFTPTGMAVKGLSKVFEAMSKARNK